MSTSSHLSVEAAGLKLIQSKDDFWKEKVTQASGIYKISGLISYFWNVRSVTVLHKAYTDLIDKVSKQMVQDNSHLPGNAQVNVSIQQGAVENHLKKQSEEALETFYKAFKGRCSKLGVDELKDEFAVYTQAARKALQNPEKLKGNDKDTQVRNSKIVTNMMPMLAKFDDIACKDMVAAFAKQKDAKSINMESFAAKSAMMSKLFGSNASSNIEASLRKATLDEGKHAEAFAKLAVSFSERGADSEFEKFKNEVLAKLPQLEKDEAKVVTFERDKPESLDQTGLLHKSWENLENLKNNFIVKRTEYSNHNADAINQIGPDNDIVKGCESVIANLANKAPKLHEVAVAYQQAKVAHDNLVKQYQELKEATVALRTRLIPENLDGEAGVMMQNKAAFYTQMQKSVVLSDVTNNVTGNEKTLFDEMDQLLKNAQLRK